jgi:hypothetical protein
MWGYSSIPQDAFSCLEKDEDLRDAIILYKAIYARKVKVAWYTTLWYLEFSKTTHAQEM